jgi:hypothetical protein
MPGRGPHPRGAASLRTDPLDLPRASAPDVTTASRRGDGPRKVERQRRRSRAPLARRRGVLAPVCVQAPASVRAPVATWRRARGRAPTRLPEEPCAHGLLLDGTASTATSTSTPPATATATPTPTPAATGGGAGPHLRRPPWAPACAPGAGRRARDRAATGAPLVERAGGAREARAGDGPRLVGIWRSRRRRCGSRVGSCSTWNLTGGRPVHSPHGRATCDSPRPGRRDHSHGGGARRTRRGDPTRRSARAAARPGRSCAAPPSPRRAEALAQPLRLPPGRDGPR